VTCDHRTGCQIRGFDHVAGTGNETGCSVRGLEHLAGETGEVVSVDGGAAVLYGYVDSVADSQIQDGVVGSLVQTVIAGMAEGSDHVVVVVHQFGMNLASEAADDAEEELVSAGAGGGEYPGVGTESASTAGDFSVEDDGVSGVDEHMVAGHFRREGNV
jgi:hypothetical protein